ncbi:D-3-phosphoglycerate dehydrogenase [Theobroma cacao]|uniref:D-3-phosphoglycerate dehydrogenase n=1 Tax=Theobroma cacao TaxID=3641 RepID=A0A061FCB2_THECC|nr:D-3-phosphoglycerate dehydrogenase [Theobroma cacao]
MFYLYCKQDRQRVRERQRDREPPKPCPQYLHGTSRSLPTKISLSPLSWRPSLHSRAIFPRCQKPRTLIVVATILKAKPTVLVAEKLGDAGIQLLKAFANVDCSYNLSPEELCTKISLCDALIVRSGTKVTREVFESSGGRVKVVGRAGVGIDNVDLPAATEQGCLLVNAPTANTIAAAEHGIALLTAMARNVAQADASVKAGKWQRNKYVGVSVVGKTLAVMGFGKVGSEVARRAMGLGMHVIAHDHYAPAGRARAIGVELVTFEEALLTADFICMHMPLTPATSKMFNDDAFSRMKRGARIVNVARGGVIDEEALLRALDSGIVAQAALDVFREEPPPKESKLVQHETVTVTPHLGASTTEASVYAWPSILASVLLLHHITISNFKLFLYILSIWIMMVQSELAPFVALTEKLGRLAVQLVAGGSGLKFVKVTYASARVNADFTAKKRGLNLTEERIVLDGSPENPLEFIQVQIANVESKFAGAISDSGEITVEGGVKDGKPHLTKVGSFGVCVSLEGSLILCRQIDQPGMIGRVGSILGEELHPGNKL